MRTPSHRTPPGGHVLRRHFLLGASTLLLASCAGLSAPAGVPRRETIDAVTASGRIFRFNAGQPGQASALRPVSGLAAGERLLGIDYRVARGQLFALGSSGRLYRLDVASATASAVGAPFTPGLQGREFGFDFNPTVDRIRVVSDLGQNLRLHPDTGAVVDFDPAAPGIQGDPRLSWAAGDPNAGRAPRIVAAAYTYNKDNEKLTTNFALDAASGSLVTQGTREAVLPAVHPNTGQLFTVGPLRVGEFESAAFDIADAGGAAFAAITARGAHESRWYEIDLSTGAARLIGVLSVGEPVTGIAIEP